MDGANAGGTFTDLEMVRVDGGDPSRCSWCEPHPIVLRHVVLTGTGRSHYLHACS